MSPCSVCGRPGQALKAVRWDGSAAPSPGVACSPECTSLVFFAQTATTPDEKRLESWRWKQRRAEVRGVAFTEAAPLHPVEREWVVLLMSSPTVKALWNEIQGGVR